MAEVPCHDGCTDCPTCEGAVRPDSPVMHDLGFAMAMQGGPKADRRWGPLAIVQAVREAILRRGEPTLADRQVLSFVERIPTDARAGPFAPKVLWDDAGSPAPAPVAVGGASPPTAHPQSPDDPAVGKSFPPRFWGPQKDREIELVRRALRRTLIWEFHPFKRGRYYTDTETGQLRRFPPIDDPENRVPPQWPEKGGAPICCVSRFLYPARLKRVEAGSAAGFQFEFGAVYEERGSCACHCCEFRQFYSFSTKDEPATQHYEDVGWFDGKTGSIVGARDPDGVPVPPPTENSVLTSYPRTWDAQGNNPKMGKDGSCIWWQEDRPMKTRKLFDSVHRWEYLGLIFDTCRDYLLVRMRFFTVRIEVSSIYNAYSAHIEDGHSDRDLSFIDDKANGDSMERLLERP